MEILEVFDLNGGLTRIAALVRQVLPRRTPRNPSLRISRSTVQRATGTPSRFSVNHTLGAP